MRTPGMSSTLNSFRFATWAKPRSVTLLPSSCRDFQVDKAADDRHLVVRDGGLRQPEAAKPGLPRQGGHEAVGIREPPHAQPFQARKGAELGHPAGRQVGGGAPLDRKKLNAVELADILQELVVHVVAFDTDIDHRVEHIGAEDVA